MDGIEFFSPVKINAGRCALEHLPAELASLGARRPILCSAEGPAAGRRLKTVVQAFSASQMAPAVAGSLPLQPTESDIDALARLCRLRDRDAFVAVGGGPAGG
ncbi:MAG: iron-containing alcohol dehydrogenase, partial [Desulfobacterales bacterium]|nr:iron-containing alcohol dehydrogenase [Desulfobacterales bacterium]